MFLVIYDIASDKLRTKFSKYLSKYGRRLQYSVFEITNSLRILDNIRTEIKTSFERKFSQSDSVLIIQIPDNAITDRFGYAANEETELLFF